MPLSQAESHSAISMLHPGQLCSDALGIIADEDELWAEKRGDGTVEGVCSGDGAYNLERA